MQANILPINLLFNEVLFRATMCLCLLLPSYPLHSIMHTAKVKWHRLPIHNLLFLSCLNPGDIEIVNAVRCHPEYQPSFDQFICDTKDNAFTMVTISHINYLYKIYSDGSGYKGGISASAVLYKGDNAIKILRYYLSTDKCHTVYEGRGSRSINGSTFTKQFKQEAQWHGDNGIRQSSTYEGHQKSVSARRSLHP